MQPPPSLDPQPRTEDDSTPRRVVGGGHFELGELLGMGATSSVYACKGLDAAIKIFESVEEDARRRFLDEGRLLTRLRHPHLVHVIAVGEADTGAPFMVLERLSGENLDRRLRREGPLPWLEVVELIAQVASALEALHQVGVIHRDVKPNNIVTVRSATGDPFVKLIDLGGAKVEDWRRVQGPGSEPVARHQTEAGMFIGTPGFFPPESGFVRPTPGFDVFGLGATIYVLCTGELPNHVDYRPMREVRSECGVPPELEALVVDAMALTPEDRIASAAEFQRRLERVREAHVSRMDGDPPRPPNSRGWTFYTTAGEDDATPGAGVRRAGGRLRIVGDGFELGELLGSGGTSSVWACKNANVAVKILSVTDEDTATLP
jgi:serine/threonine protein kinase